MATIKRVDLHRRSIPLRRPFVTAVRTALVVDVLLVEVSDSDGRHGWGEAPTSWRVTGESVEGVTAAITGPLREAIIGTSYDDPAAASDALERAAVRNSSARMALDCALFDLAAQASGVTLARYLGAEASAVRTDVTLSAARSAPEGAALLRTALEYVDAGFDTLKVKAGAGGDDVRTLVDLRRAVGPRVSLRVDANQGWTPQRALEVIGALEDAHVDLEFVEQPVHRDDLDGLAFVTHHSQTPVMADESVWTRRDLREILRDRAVDMVNIKLAKTGGLREALALHRAARDAGLGVIIGCMAESHVGVGSAAALAAVVDSQASSPLAHDLDGGLLLTRSPVRGGVGYEGPRVEWGHLPGAGITALDDEPSAAR